MSGEGAVDGYFNQPNQRIAFITILGEIIRKTFNVISQKKNELLDKFKIKGRKLKFPMVFKSTLQILKRLHRKSLTSNTY